MYEGILPKRQPKVLRRPKLINQLKSENLETEEEFQDICLMRGLQILLIKQLKKQFILKNENYDLSLKETEFEEEFDSTEKNKDAETTVKTLCWRSFSVQFAHKNSIFLNPIYEVDPVFEVKVSLDYYTKIITVDFTRTDRVYPSFYAEITDYEYPEDLIPVFKEIEDSAVKYFEAEYN